MPPLVSELLTFYADAREYCVKAGYKEEIELVQNRYFKDIDVPEFLVAYVYCVFNVGMKNQIAEKMFDKFCDSGCDLNAVGHPYKRKAIGAGINKCGRWFAELMNCSTDMERVEYLDTLPMIGNITKYHLARNLGMDVAKPDRHLVRLMKGFQFDDVQAMCKYVADITGDRIGTVDVVLWRYSNLNGSRQEIKL
jgi:hypothetical protein